MLLPRWFTIITLALFASLAALVLFDWITSERIGTWALYYGAGVLLVLMVFSIAANLRSRAARRSSDRLPLSRPDESRPGDRRR